MNPRFQKIIFDLDGTLVDSKQGVIDSVVSAFEHVGFLKTQVTGIEIGPPMQETIKKILGPERIDLYDEVLKNQRAYYEETGLYSAKVFSGIPEALKLLTQLSLPSVELFVATSKAEIFSLKMLEHFKLKSFFSRIHGSELSGKHSDKAELLAHLIEIHHFKRSSAVMIGDRRHDILGAKANGLSSIGVTWGYGSEKELRDAGADIICNHPSQLGSLLFA